MRIADATTFLFVPGNRPDRFAKAAQSGADAFILDLEDAVAPDEKDSARQAVAANAGSLAHRPVVRINGAGTAWFAPDVEALAAISPAAVMLPKAEGSEAIALLAARLPGVPVLPLIESARGIAAMAQTASAPGVCRLVFGSVDLQLDLGIAGDGDELLYFRSKLVLESRLAALPPPVDGVSLAIDDPEALGAESRRARRAGFGGKLCIHPRQIAAVASAFAPDPAEIERARRIVAASDRAGGGAASLDGQMIDQPVVEMARRLLSRAAAMRP